MRKLLLAGAIILSGLACFAAPGLAASAGVHQTSGSINLIRHVVIIMQENRSFDSYFGTYPGADGIPGLAGNPGTVPCLPRKGGACVEPYHSTLDKQYGGPHTRAASAADNDGGKMDGFVEAVQQTKQCRKRPKSAACIDGWQDVMGYHTGADIPNYWTYAHDFVLEDHMFESVASWSLPSHLYLVSNWSAKCANTDPSSCVNDPAHTAEPSASGPYAWTEITWLLHKYGVSWAYYVSRGPDADCANGAALTCPAGQQSPSTPNIWNPLPKFTDVAKDGQLSNIRPLDNFYAAAQAGTLPAVSWIVPNGTVSEHPPALITAGQTYVTGLINTIMRSRDWGSTAIFLAWDDWGGFYDDAVPPRVDEDGYGLRVPGLVISPYAKKGYIDHQVLSFDAYNKFIEDDFLHGQRLDPRTDGRPDRRPNVREDAPQLGDLAADFDFDQAPRPPVLLPVDPETDLR